MMAVLLMLGSFPVCAEGETYTVYDRSAGLNEEFSSYDSAYRFYQDNREGYDNLILKENDRVLFMEYGIVEFKTGEACEITVNYHSEVRDSEDYLNGCYGIDAAYLSTDRNGRTVTFKIADDIGSADIEDLILHPYDELEMEPSVYTVRDHHLVHDIRSQLKEDYYSSSLTLDDAPSYLKEGTSYYSYDGHWFYEDFRKMIDDYREDSFSGSVYEDAYYNYFQYLPHRSLSNYTCEEAEAYFNKLGIDKRLMHYTDYNSDGAADEVNRSQLYGIIPDFFVYQDIYGTNAMMLLSSAVSESSYGRSYQSYVRNNLYLTSAYENNTERQENRYSDISSSIYSHAKYFISSMYSSHLRDSYAGTFYGNKKAGLNANYSLDPYYGERSASLYYQLDQAMGKKDQHSHCLGIIKDEERVRFYRDADMEDILFTLYDVSELSFVVLEVNEDYCRINVDASFSDDYRYDFEGSVAYVPTRYFTLFLDEDQAKDYDLIEIEYDFAGGEFHGYETLNVKHPDSQAIADPRPQKQGYEFIGYDEGHTALYRPITSIEVISGLDTSQIAGEPLDLKDAFLKVHYENEESVIPVTTDMVSGFDVQRSGTQTVRITYCGITAEQPIEVSEDPIRIREEIRTALENKDYETVRSHLKEVRYPFTFSEIREADYELKQKHGRNYVIRDETERYDLSISGLDLSLEDRESFSFFGDTYYVIVKDIDPKDVEAIMKVAGGYGFTAEEGIRIGFGFNYQDMELDGPAIVQLDLEGKQNDLVYTVYHLDEEGDVIKCRTTQSEHFIQFLIEESGSYLVLSMPSANEYDLKDNTEDLSYENMGFDNHKANVRLMSLLLIVLVGLIGITVYYIAYHRRENVWKDFRRSLQREGTVPEEKRKN